MTGLAGPPVRRRCGSCGALGPVVDGSAPLTVCVECGSAPTEGDRAARFGARHWALTLLVFFAAILAVLLILQAGG